MWDSLHGPIGISSKAITLAFTNSADNAILKIAGKNRLRPGWWCESPTQSKNKVSKFRRERDYKDLDRAEYRRIRNTHLANIRRVYISSMEKIFKLNQQRLMEKNLQMGQKGNCFRQQTGMLNASRWKLH